MSTREAFVLASLALVWGGCAGTTAPETPNLGRAATPAEVAGWDISIAPDGRGLPSGSGTSAEGALVFAQKCQACHGDKGVGGPNDRLVGGQGTLASKTPVRTIGSYWPYATTVFDYVRRSMPFAQPHSLTDSEVYAVTAYLLNLNGIIGEQDVMNSDALPKVKMPNRDNFILVHPWKPRVP
jgi:cytochrome c